MPLKFFVASFCCVPRFLDRKAPITIRRSTSNDIRAHFNAHETLLSSFTLLLSSLGMNGNATFQIGSPHLDGKSHTIKKKNIQKTSSRPRKDSIGPGTGLSGYGGIGYPSNIGVLAFVRD